ncbi:MAG: hypothetical protein ACYDG4_13475 [Desulfuromonadaceae bacterium]
MTKNEIIKDLDVLENLLRDLQSIWGKLFDLRMTEKEKNENPEVMRIRGEIEKIKEKYEPVFMAADVNHDDYEASTTEDFLRFTLHITQQW